jgi:hypothetical protein
MSWSAEGASSGQAADFGADDIQYDNLDRSAKPGSSSATFVVVLQTADVRDGNDPGLESMHRPFETAIVYAPATGRRLG